MKYEEILSYFNSKKDDDNLKWLQFHKKFEKEGKQGITGLVKINDELCVYKTSRYLNYLVNHELLIMNSLNEIAKFCPYFCRSYGSIDHLVDLDYKKKDNPFDVNSKHPITQETLLMEYLPYENLYSLIKNNEISGNIILSTVKQILLALSIVHENKNFSHYDLHSCNILMKPCNKDLVYLYVLNEENQLCVPTNGYIPKIIDFGFSYIKEMENNPIWSSLAHTEIGFMTSLFDSISDLKLFLVTVSNEMKRFRDDKNTNIFRNIVRNIFNPLNIDWESGWDQKLSVSAIDSVANELESVKIKSHLWKKYNHLCLDLIQSLIQLPLKKKDTTSLKGSYLMLTNEFAKIESNINNSSLNLYILKQIVNYVRELKDSYLNKETRNEAIKEFKENINDMISDLVEYYIPKLNYEKLLCGCIAFSNAVEGLMHRHIKSQFEIKKLEYNQLKLKTPEHILGALEVNIYDEYIYTDSTEIVVLDCINKDNSKLVLSEDNIDILNNTHPLLRGSYLYEIYKENTDRIVFE